ncbi:unnamed protein product [Effrenium voratum]|nr:unnamed protein product [Effrenium voratum]
MAAALSSCELRWRIAAELLRGAALSGVEPNEICGNAAMNAMCRCLRWASAAKLLQGMRTCLLTPNDVSYSTLLSADSWRRALHLPKSTTVSFNAAVSACERLAHWEAACVLIDSMSVSAVVADIISFNAARSALGRAAIWPHALGGLRQDAITIGTSISGGGSWAQAAQLLASAWPPRPRRCFNACIAVFEQNSLWSAVFAIMRQMKKETVEADQISWNSRVSASGSWGRAMENLHAMCREQVAADEISVNSAVDACKTGGHWQLAYAKLAGMNSMSLASAVTFNSALNSLKCENSWVLLLFSLRSMWSFQVEPSIVSFNTGLALCERWPVALLLLASSGIRADGVSFGAALGIGWHWPASLALWRLAAVNAVQVSSAGRGAVVQASASDRRQWRRTLGLFTGAQTELSRLAACEACEAGGHAKQLVPLLRAVAASALKRARLHRENEELRPPLIELECGQALA